MAIENIKNLFLNNLSPRQTVFKNTFWLALAEGITRVLKLFLFIYIARILGVTEFGKFTFALAFVSLFLVFSDFGLSSIITREFSREKEKEKEFSAILSLKVIFSLITLVFILACSFFVTPDPLIQKAIWILGIYVVISSFNGIIFAFFQARQKMEYQSWFQIFQAMIITGAGFFVIFNFPSVKNLSYSYLFAALTTLILVLLFFHFKIYRLFFLWEKSVWQKFLLMSWPLALATVFGTIYGHIDSVMMGYLGQITETGWYNAAFRVASAGSLLMVLISQSFYPVLSIAFKESKERLQKIWNYQMEIMILLAVPIVIGGIVLASKIIDFVYDPRYFASILAFQILIITVGLVFLANPLKQVLIASNQQQKIFWVTLGGATVNIILNFVLIPSYSLYGAAIATVTTYLLILSLLLRFVQKFTPVKPLNLKILFSFIGAGISSLAMYFIITLPQIYNLNVLFSVSLGGGLYLICFFVYKEILKKTKFSAMA